MPLLTEEECIRLGGTVETKPGSPTWKGARLKVCRIAFERLPPNVKAKFPWIKGGTRVIIIGKE